MPVAERNRSGVMAVAAENGVNANADGEKFIVLRGRRIAKKKKRKCVKCKCTQMSHLIRHIGLCFIGQLSFPQVFKANSGWIYVHSGEKM